MWLCLCIILHVIGNLAHNFANSAYNYTISALFISFMNGTLQQLTLRPSVLWRCWLGGRKGIRPVKIERWGAGVVICLEQGADLHMAQLMPLPLTVSCFSKIQIGFTFLVPTHPGNPGQRAVKRVCVCVMNGTLAHIINSPCNSERMS